MDQGTAVIITNAANEEFYKNGAKAVLVEMDEDGDWWANFRGQGNPEGSFKDHDDGIWCIGREGTIFEESK